MILTEADLCTAKNIFLDLENWECGKKYFLGNFLILSNSFLNFLDFFLNPENSRKYYLKFLETRNVETFSYHTPIFLVLRKKILRKIYLKQEFFSLNKILFLVFSCI